MRCKKNNQLGFSLIELLVYVAVLAIVTLVVSEIFLILNKSRAQIESKSEVNTNLRFALETIKHDLTASSSVITPAVAGTASSTLVVNISGIETTYCIAENKLRRQAGGACTGASEALTSDKVVVESLSFSRSENINPELNKKKVTIRINLTISYNSTVPEWQFSQTEITGITSRPIF